jgi:DNA polymerase-3 subunit alpha
VLGVEDLDRQDYAMERIRETERDARGRFRSPNPFKRGEATASGMAGAGILPRPDPLELEVLHNPEAADPEVLKMSGDGHTVGVFQFHTPGMTALLRKIKPDSIFDLAAANALYRPGAMEYANEYAKRKHGEIPESEWYWHPSVEPYMRETYGVLAFQEQVMAICKGLGNFTGGQADGIRKGISKWYRLGKDKCIQKLREAGFEEQWFKGTAENGLERSAAELIWNNILDFAGYGFNKSHSVSYALQGYQDMDLKRKNALEFYAAILSLPDDDDGWINRVVRESGAVGVQIKPPDINRSMLGFSVEDDKILYGLLAVKGIGDSAVWDIIENRPYRSYAEFCQKNTRHAGGSGKALIMAGAFEELDGRDFLLSEVRKGDRPKDAITFSCGEKILVAQGKRSEEARCPTHGDECGRERVEEEWEMWTVAEHINHNRKLKKPRPLPEDRTPPSLRQIMDAEKEMLGVLVSVEPSIDKHWDTVKHFVDSQADFEEMADDDDVQIAGEIVTVKPIQTKKGQPMAFVDVARGGDQFSCTVFTGEFLRYAEVLEQADSVIVKGRKNSFKGRESIIVNRLQNLEDFVQEVRA